MELVTSHICMKKDIGVHDNLFGGIMMGWLDEAAAIHIAQKIDTSRIVTLKVSEVLFKEPIKVGQLIKIYAEITNIGTTSVTVKLEARRHKPESGKQKIAAEISMIFVKIDDDGEASPISKHIRDKIRKEIEKK